MRQARDRRLARWVLLVNAAAVLVVTAAVESPAIRLAEVADDPYAYAELLARALDSDQVGYAATVDFERQVDDRLVEQRIEVAKIPSASIEVDERSAVLRSDDREWTCFDADEEWTCAETTDQRTGITIGGAGLVVAAAGSGDYRFERRGDRTVDDVLASCFGILLVGTRPVAGIGRETELCFAADGLLVFVRRATLASIDTQALVDVQPIDEREFDRRFERASRGEVTR